MVKIKDVIDDMIVQIRVQNDFLEDGIKSAEHLIKRIQKDVEAFKALLLPQRKAGHLKTLRKALESSEWELSIKVKELGEFKYQLECNNLMLKFLCKHSK